MPFTWTCVADGAVVENVEESHEHERAAHGGEPQEWRTGFYPHGQYSRRLWSCARCASGVDRADDGSMLCDDCKAAGPADPLSELLAALPPVDELGDDRGRWLP